MSWHDAGMDLDALYALEPVDRRTFLLGRLVTETTSMDAALRFLHAALDGQTAVDAFRDAPDAFQQNAKKCAREVATTERLTDEERPKILATLDAARAVYERRNRFVHDLLRDDLLSKGWELMRLNRKGEEFTTTSADAMIALVCELVGVTYRLRGAAIYVLQGGWAVWAFGTVKGQWDGTADASR